MTIDAEIRTAPVETQDRPPLVIRRVDAIPVALPLKKPMKMAGVTIAHAHNVVVRIEAEDGTIGWGEAASAPTIKRLLEIADKCPVHNTLTSEIDIRTMEESAQNAAR